MICLGYSILWKDIDYDDNAQNILVYIFSHKFAERSGFVVLGSLKPTEDQWLCGDNYKYMWGSAQMRWIPIKYLREVDFVGVHLSGIDQVDYVIGHHSNRGRDPAVVSYRKAIASVSSWCLIERLY